MKVGVRPDPRRKTRWWLLAIIALVVLVPAAVASQRVKVEPGPGEHRAFALRSDGSRLELGLPNGADSMAFDVNNEDEVIGIYGIADGSEAAFLSRGGELVGLDAQAGGTVFPKALNDAGRVVGSVWTDGEVEHAFVWQDGRMTDLGTLGGSGATAVDVNRHGQVLCAVFAPSAAGGGTTERIVLWRDGSVMELAGLSDYLGEVRGPLMPLRLNDRGQVLVYVAGRLVLWERGSVTEVASSVDDQRADLTDGGVVYYARREADGGQGWVGKWDAGTSTNMGGLGGYLTWPTAANEAGVIAGVAQTSTGEGRAFVWGDGDITLLRVGGDNSEVSAINDRGTVVGYFTKE